MTNFVKHGLKIDIQNCNRKKGTERGRENPTKISFFIDKEIRLLSSNPRPSNSKKLTEKEGYRIRAGNYRILYTIDDKGKTVVVYRIKIKGKSTYK